jgi:hypothetical protein
MVSGRRFSPAARLSLTEPFSDQVLAFVADGGALFAIARGPGESWGNQTWQALTIRVATWRGGRRTVAAGSQGVDAIAVEGGAPVLWLIGADNRLYRGTWKPREMQSVWEEWHRPSGMVLSQVSRIFELQSVLYIQDQIGVLWAGGAAMGAWVWQRLDPPAAEFPLLGAAPVAVVAVDGALHKILTLSGSDEVWCVDHILNGAPRWTRIGAKNEIVLGGRLELYAVQPAPDEVHVFAVDAEGRLLARQWTQADGWDAGGGWRNVGAAGEPAAQARRMWTCSRTIGTTEVLWLDKDDELHWRWWS